MIVLMLGDITNEIVCSEIVEKTVAQFGKIDILVNNAGMVNVGTFEHSPVAELDQLMNTNVRSIVVLTQLCIPYLKKTKGSVVNLSSLYGYRPIADAGYQCMAKAAVNMYTQCLAMELAPHGVRVNAVNPGLIRTSGLI